MNELKELSNEQLLKLYNEYDDLIYGDNPCYSKRDLIYYDEIVREMDKREED
jgi:hypothetical protein